MNNHEIGDIGWFTLEEALKLIRERHFCRKEVLSKLHKHLVGLLQNSDTTA